MQIVTHQVLGRRRWKDLTVEGINKEIASLIAKNVFEVVPIAKGITLTTSKPVLKIEHYMVHIVVQGFTQREGVDYKEVFAPITNLGSIHIIYALTTKYDLEPDEMDVSTAYINGKLEEELYMLPSDCVEIKLGYC